MEKTSLRIRLDFAPLDVAVSLKVLTTGSALTQAYNGSTGDYEPDRLLSPTVIVPVVSLSADDGSLSSPYGNEWLGEMRWYCDDTDISTLDEWDGLYEILTDGSTRGGLRIYRNLRPGDGHTLRFEAYVNDARTGINYPIVTESVDLVTIDMGDESGQYTLSADCGELVRYNPFLDNLSVYEYQVANGTVTDTSALRAQATDSNAYLREIPLTLFSGKGVYEGEWTARVYEITGVTSSGYKLSDELTVTEDDDNEFNSISADRLVMDLRLVEDGKRYLVKAFIGGEEAASCEFAVRWRYMAYTLNIVNEASRRATDTRRYDMVQINTRTGAQPYGYLFLRILWYTGTQYLSSLRHNEGDRTLYTIASTMAGSTESDGWIDEWVESGFKGCLSVAVDENGDELVDENGSTLIFN